MLCFSMNRCSLPQAPGLLPKHEFARFSYALQKLEWQTYQSCIEKSQNNLKNEKKNIFKYLELKWGGGGGGDGPSVE